ncbi:hypothetical protein CBL_07983 [Carabus blaptoides fortunei]
MARLGQCCEGGGSLWWGFDSKDWSYLGDIEGISLLLYDSVVRYKPSRTYRGTFAYSFTSPVWVEVTLWHLIKIPVSLQDSLTHWRVITEEAEGEVNTVAVPSPATDIKCKFSIPLRTCPTAVVVPEFGDSYSCAPLIPRKVKVTETISLLHWQVNNFPGIDSVSTRLQGDLGY